MTNICFAVVHFPAVDVHCSIFPLNSFTPKVLADQGQGVFSMQVDLFNEHAAWQYYVYTSFVLMFIVLSSYYLLRSGKRVVRHLVLLVVWLFKRLVSAWPRFNNSPANAKGSLDNKRSGRSFRNLEKQSILSTDKIPSILK